MTPRPQALRVGLFALLGLALLGAAIVAVVGVQVFKTSERAVINVNGSVQGLALGAPVVFRGVRVGGVRRISLTQAGGQPNVAVELEFDQAQLMALVQPSAVAGATVSTTALPQLVQRGLSAQLATQSLLTGQMYVDLDLRPVTSRSPATPFSASPLPSNGMLEIPTQKTKFQSVQDQLEGLDLNAMAKDLSATLAATKGLVSAPEVKQTLADMRQAAAALARLSAALEARWPALADAARSGLAGAGNASNQVAGAAQRWAGAADRVGGVADRVGERVATAADRVGAASDQAGQAATRAQQLLTPGSPLHSSVLGAADELARSAAALRGAVAEDSATVQSLQRALGDTSRAARALRELAEQLEQQPQSLLRGKEPQP